MTEGAEFLSQPQPEGVTVGKLDTGEGTMLERATAEQSSFSDAESQVIFTPALFYRCVVARMASQSTDPYFAFLACRKDVVKEYGNLVFPRRLELPRPFIVPGDVPLTARECSTLYLLPASVAKAYFDFIAGSLFVHVPRGMVAHVAVISLPLVDPFAEHFVSRDGPPPLRDVSAIIVEGDAGRYLFEARPGYREWEVVHTPTISENLKETVASMRAAGNLASTLESLQGKVKGPMPPDAPLLPMPSQKLSEDDTRRLIARYKEVFPEYAS